MSYLAISSEDYILRVIEEKLTLKCTLSCCHNSFPFLAFLGLIEDDLRETAYEILLACAGAAGYTFSLYMVCKYFLIGSKKKREMLLSLLFICVLSSVI